MNIYREVTNNQIPQYTNYLTLAIQHGINKYNYKGDLMDLYKSIIDQSYKITKEYIYIEHKDNFNIGHNKCFTVFQLCSVILHKLNICRPKQTYFKGSQ